VNGTEEEPRRKMDDFVVGRDRQRPSAAAAVRDSCTHRPCLRLLLDEDHHIDRRSNGVAAGMIASWYVFLSLSFLSGSRTERRTPKGNQSGTEATTVRAAAAAFDSCAFLAAENRVPKSVAFEQRGHSCP
jgi:hypothetical protein